MVSIIMPCYNSELFIGRAIESVQHQTFQNWELIIIDDFSNDFSIEIISEYIKEDKRIRLFKRNINSGRPSVPRNLGIKYAKGDYIAFLDCDDYWAKNKLEIQLSFMQNNNYFFTHTSYYWNEFNSNKIIGKVIAPHTLDYNRFIQQGGIGCLTVMYNSNALGKFYFSENIPLSEDYHYWLQILKKCKTVYGIQDPLAYYSIRDNSLSRQKFLMMANVFFILFKYEKLSFTKSIFSVVKLSFNWFFRRLCNY